MLPNWRCPDCPATFSIRSPSRTQAPLPPPKLTLLRRLKAFCSRAACCSGGARNSPSSTSTITRISPAVRAMSASRPTDTPVARITVSSLPRASVPRPSSEPMSATMGSSS